MQRLPDAGEHVIVVVGNVVKYVSNHYFGNISTRPDGLILTISAIFRTLSINDRYQGG
jgi:hypothetical protein